MSEKKALFIDRDGVINRMVRYAYGWDSPQRIEDVKLVNGIEKIIGWANDQKIPVIEITNQPGVAKGKLEQDESEAIQRRVEVLLKRKRAQIDGVYICPHHPEGVVPELSVVCDCRKPKPGLLLKAAKDLGIDLEKSIFLGDNETDALAGKAAGCKTILYLHHENEPEKVARSRSTDVADYKVRSSVNVKKILDKFLD